MVFSLVCLLLFQPEAASLGKLYEQELARVELKFGPVAAETGRAALDLGLFLLRQGKPDAAALALERALKILGSGAAREAYAQALLGQKRVGEAEAQFREVAKSEERGMAARAFTVLADLSSDRAAACPLYKRALALELSIGRLNDLGLCEREQGRQKEAIVQFRRALAIDKNGKNPETAVTLNNLASALLDSGAGAEAELHQRRALRILDATLGPRHTRTALSASNLGDILKARGKAAEARRYYEVALQVFTLRLGPEHEWTRDAQAAVLSTSRP